MICMIFTHLNFLNNMACNMHIYDMSTHEGDGKFKLVNYMHIYYMTIYASQKSHYKIIFRHIKHPYLNHILLIFRFKFTIKFIKPDIPLINPIINL